METSTDSARWREGQSNVPPPLESSPQKERWQRPPTFHQ